MNRRILGIDCGTALTGWAVLQQGDKRGAEFKIHGYGVIRTKADLAVGARLNIIYNSTIEIIEKFAPDLAAVESLFYFKNKKTVMTVGQARGVVLLAAEKKGLTCYDYTPLQIKQSVTGYGRANKKQVQNMVKKILKIDKIPKPDDAADALAVAICHLNTNFKQIS